MIPSHADEGEFLGELWVWARVYLCSPEVCSGLIWRNIQPNGEPYAYKPSLDSKLQAVIWSCRCLELVAFELRAAIGSPRAGEVRYGRRIWRLVVAGGRSRPGECGAWRDD